jgi:hypothetical protein
MVVNLGVIDLEGDAGAGRQVGRVGEDVPGGRVDGDSDDVTRASAVKASSSSRVSSSPSMSETSKADLPPAST